MITTIREKCRKRRRGERMPEGKMTILRPVPVETHVFFVPVATYREQATEIRAWLKEFAPDTFHMTCLRKDRQSTYPYTDYVQVQIDDPNAAFEFKMRWR